MIPIPPFGDAGIGKSYVKPESRIVTGTLMDEFQFMLGICKHHTSSDEFKGLLAQFVSDPGIAYMNVVGWLTETVSTWVTAGPEYKIGVLGELRLALRHLTEDQLHEVLADMMEELGTALDGDVELGFEHEIDLREGVCLDWEYELREYDSGLHIVLSSTPGPNFKEDEV
jgi:hypothetical protein